MLPAWEYHRNKRLLLSPSHDVHHGFGAIRILFHIQHVIEYLEQLCIVSLVFAAQYECRTHEVA